MSQTWVEDLQTNPNDIDRHRIIQAGSHIEPKKMVQVRLKFGLQCLYDYNRIFLYSHL